MQTQSCHISVVTPVYGCSTSLLELYQRLKETLTPITENYEIIFVNDASPDDAWEGIEVLAKNDPRVKGIKLSRNFGQHYAITAGLDYCIGEWVVVMDCDLQDKPEEILKLYNKAQEGFNIVLGRRNKRKDTFFKKLSSFFFHRLLSYLTGTELDKTVANFGIYNRKVVDAINKMREPIRYFPTMVKWVGFNTAKINVDHNYRQEGRSGYNYNKLLRLALDIILANSDKPIKLLVKFGLLVSFSAFVFAIVFFILWLMGDIEVLGYTSLVVSIWFLSGVIIATLGLMGLYVGKTFEGVKNRPIYIIDKTTFDD
ncbi:MAG: glycosyltransferase family 2 protein [Bacteroidales bacterium]|nr:glycosyltransferase family 2 protein [Bacteroidales bacterium]